MTACLTWRGIQPCEGRLARLTMSAWRCAAERRRLCESHVARSAAWGGCAPRHSAPKARRCRAGAETDCLDHTRHVFLQRRAESAVCSIAQGNALGSWGLCRGALKGQPLSDVAIAKVCPLRGRYLQHA